MIPLRFFLGSIFLVLTVVFLLEYFIVGQAVYGDGRYYWAFTRSMYFHHSFDISDAMMHHYSPLSNNSPIPLTEQNAKGYNTDILIGEFSLGISFFWLPLYAIADIVARLLSSLGIPIVLNGYSDVYQVIVGIGNIGFVITGVYLLYQMLKKYFIVSIVQISLVTLVFGTNLFYYSGVDVINSHPFSFMMAAVVAWAFVRFLETKYRKYLFLQAIAVGMLSANRSQDMLYVLVPFIAFGYLVYTMKKKDIVIFIKALVVVSLGGIAGYMPQILLLSVSEQRLALFPHIEDRSLLQAFDFLRPHLFEVLVNTKTGLLYYSWALLVAFLGLALFIKRRLFIGYVFLGIALAQLYIMASWMTWDQAASYGIRMLISSMPLLAFGIAEIYTRLCKKFSLSFLITICIISIFHQLGMILGFKLFIQDPTNVGTELSRSGQLKLHIIQLIKSVF